jgi:transcriptional regulator with XRE-family HTH domain
MWQDGGVPHGTKPPPSDLQQAVAGILRAEKGRKQVSLQQIADATGLFARSQLSAIFKGTKHVDVEQLDALCYALGLNLTAVIAEAERLTDARRLSPDYRVKPL